MLRIFRSACAGFLMVAAASSPLAAQSTISTVDRHGFAANGGWLDFRPSPADGVVVTGTCLGGYAWAGNLGWVSFGDGLPDNGHTYSNATAGDCGVNLAADGKLTGYAWAPNVGWIVFEGAFGKPVLDFHTGRVRGHAWAPNLGWLTFETAAAPLVTTTITRTDSDGDGIEDAYEAIHFGKLSLADATTDHDGDGVSDLDESLADTNPNDASAFLRIISHSYADAFTKAVLTFTSRPSRLYRIEHSTDLLPPWKDSDFGLFAPDPGISTVREVKVDPSPRRFFRVLAIRPLEP